MGSREACFQAESGVRAAHGHGNVDGHVVGVANDTQGAGVWWHARPAAVRVWRCGVVRPSQAACRCVSGPPGVVTCFARLSAISDDKIMLGVKI